MHGLPDFLKEKLNEQYGEALCAVIERGMSERRVTSFRVNTLKGTPGDVAEMLRADGIECSPAPLGDTAFVTSCGAHEISRTRAYESGLIYLQSLSSMLPVMFLGAQAGEDILDMAASPGGKTSQIAAVTGGKACITACEKNAVRFERLKFNMQRQGVGRVSLIHKDACALDKMFVFDRILLDAPCSGSGTLELWRDEPPAISEELVTRSTKTQRRMLSCALDRLKSGHEMIYSTCSLLREENEDAVRSVLSRAQIIPLEAPEYLPLLPSATGGCITVAPSEMYEGFFIAKLRKKG